MLQRLIKRIEARIAEHRDENGEIDPSYDDYVSGLEDALNLAKEIQEGSR